MLQAVNVSVNVITGGVEIAQRGEFEAAKLFVPGHKFFYFKFCKAVIVFGVLGMGFVNRKILGLSKNRRAR